MTSKLACNKVQAMKKCCRCKKTKPVEEFNFKQKSLGLRAKACKECTRLAIRKHYSKNRDYYLEKARQRNRKQRKIVQEYVYKYLSTHPCTDCGENDPVVLEFDHKSGKLDNIASLMKKNHALTKIKNEILKCEVRCANCHRRKTAEEFKWYKNKPAPVA